MRSISFPCPACGRWLNAQEEKVGTICQCPHCGKAVPIPEASPVKEALEPTAAFAMNPADKTNPHELGTLHPDESVEDRPISQIGTLSPRPDKIAPSSLGATDNSSGDAPSPSAKKLLVSGYEILSELGRGGMGVVYKARQVKLKRLVALKMILAGAHAGAKELTRFRIEAEAVARIQHPNIVQIYEIGEHDGLPFFSLEYVEGGTLEKKMARKPLPFDEAAQLIETLARAVHAAHQRGIVHRDLKPANVLLTPQGQPKITDFGVAKQLDAMEAQTGTGAVMGTPIYMAPEQAAGKSKEIGPATDVYSLGAMLYVMLTGQPPFRGETAFDTLMLVIGEEPPPPSRFQPKLPRDLETICLKCLRKAPSRRYPSAEELAADLRRYLNDEPIRARPIGPAERLWRWIAKNPLPTTLLVAVTLAAVVGLWHLSRLSEKLLQSAALLSAVQQSDVLDEVNTFYSSEVVDRVKPIGIEVTHNYTAHKGAIPAPATLTIELGNHISAKSKSGMQVRLYSDYPFKTRKDGGPRDDFERKALATLIHDPNKPYYSFEQDKKGEPVLRYATARRMKESCVECHNTHPDRPVHEEWKVGDVRGVLEIIRPLDKDINRSTNESLQETFVLIAVICGSLSALSTLALIIGHWRQSQTPETTPGG